MSDIFQGQKSRHIYEKLTICEMHRQLYDLIMISDCENKDKMIELIEKAYLMGVKLIDKLAEYNLKYKFFSPSDEPTDIEEAKRVRKLRVDLGKEKDRAVGNRLRPKEQQTD